MIIIRYFLDRVKFPTLICKLKSFKERLRLHPRFQHFNVFSMYRAARCIRLYSVHTYIYTHTGRPNRMRILENNNFQPPSVVANKPIVT